MSFDHQRWVGVNPRYRFFLPRKVLGLVFRAKLAEALEDAFARCEIRFHGQLRHLSDPKAFHSFVRELFRCQWVVHCKRPFGGPEYVLRYLGRYTHRVAISNHRLVSFANGEVTFRWRDRAHGNRELPMTLKADEFLRRFLLHLLPKGFVRIRNFGFLAHRRRARLLPLCFQCLESAPDSSTAQTQPADTSGLWKCPRCGGPMIVILRIGFFRRQRPRSPPRRPLMKKGASFQV
jgi:hypothetical protein